MTMLFGCEFADRLRDNTVCDCELPIGCVTTLYVTVNSPIGCVTTLYVAMNSPIGCVTTLYVAMNSPIGCVTTLCGREFTDRLSGNTVCD